MSQALVWLRRHLEPAGVPRGAVLVTDRLSVGLNPEAVETDVAAFEAAREAARQAETPEARAAALDRAVALYAADLLPGEYADWALTERRRLLDAYLAALQERAALYEQGGAGESALDLARRAVAADPLHEEAQRELIRLLAATGRFGAALLQFRDFQNRLAAEIGAEPSPETRALVERIRREQQGRTEAAPAAVPAPRPPGLPPPLTRFFGREGEAGQIARLIHDEGVRLVTLIGAGGAGKTRLGLTAAAGLASQFDGAVAFVPLADLDDPHLIPGAVAAALRLNVPAARPALEVVADALAARPFLLVLDNLEHLAAGGAASVVRELLDRAPSLALLVTSRHRLGLEGEREVAVASLPLPPPDASHGAVLDSPAVQLFADRARAVRPDFAVTAANAAAVAGICERLEGIPLAIELCAAWAQTLTPAQMLEKLSRRFDLLVSRRSDITPRHRTLRAALEYSYLQLPAELQELFRRLSVFRGGWSLEAAGAVCFDTPPDTLVLLAALTELRERSLVLAEEVGDGAEMRYRLLETLREYAGELLTYAEGAACRRAHAAYFLAVAEGNATSAAPEPEPSWLALVSRERDNLRAALAWGAEERAADIGLRLAAALGPYWSARGPLPEGERWLRQLLDVAETTDPRPSAEVLSRAWGVLGHLVWSQGEYDAARAAHERALDLRREAGDAAGIAESLYHLGITAYRQTDFAASRAFLEESLTIARARDDTAGVARVLLNLGNIALDESDHAAARPLFEQSLALERSLGNRRREASVLNNLGLLVLATGNREEAARIFEESVAIHRALTDDGGVVTALANLATCARLLGETERARSLLAEGLRLSAAVGDRFIIVHYLLQIGILEGLSGDAGRGAFLLSAALRLFERVSGSRRITGAEGYQEALDAARGRLGEAGFAATWARGESAPLDAVVAEALAGDNVFD